MHDGEGGAIWQGNFEPLDDVVAAGQVERDAGESGAHFKAGEAGGTGGGLASVEDFGAEASASPVGVNEKGADLGGVDCWIEKVWFTDGRVVAAEKSFAVAPTAAADKDSGAGGACFSDKVGAVGDELGVEAEQSAECTVNLLGRVIVPLQAADRCFDEGVERGFVGVSGEAEIEINVRHAGENRTAKRAQSVTQT